MRLSGFIIIIMRLSGYYNNYQVIIIIMRLSGYYNKYATWK